MWLCARFPLVLLDRDPAADLQLLATTPIAVLDQRCIIDTNRAAYQAGVRPGQPLTVARSLCPALQCRTPSPERMQRRLEQLALWGYRFTPEVSLAPPSALLLNVTGSLKLFHGFRPLYRRFQWGFRKRRMPAAYGLGHTPLAAELISYSNTDISSLLDHQGLLDKTQVISLLNRLSIQHLPCEEKQRQQLHTMGLTTLGAVNALPRSALTRRFGPPFSALLDRLYGSAADLRPAFQPPDHFYSERQFNGGLTRSEELRFPMAALLGDLEHFLQLKQWMSRHLHWQFCYCDGQQDTLSMPISHLHFDRRRVLSLVLLKLETFKLRGPVDTLVLHCDAFETVTQSNNELFSHEVAGLCDQQHRERFVVLLDKLQARLGPDQVWQPVNCNEHLPEQGAGRAHPLSAKPRVSCSTATTKPLWLLPDARQLPEHNGQPYWQSPLQLLQGPERIDNQWWQQRQARDYYIARTDSGVFCWVYRDCLQQRWYLHGLFG